MSCVRAAAADSQRRVNDVSQSPQYRKTPLVLSHTPHTTPLAPLQHTAHSKTHTAAMTAHSHTSTAAGSTPATIQAAVTAADVYALCATHDKAAEAHTTARREESPPPCAASSATASTSTLLPPMLSLIIALSSFAQQQRPQPHHHHYEPTQPAEAPTWPRRNSNRPCSGRTSNSCSTTEIATAIATTAATSPAIIAVLVATLLPFAFTPPLTASQPQPQEHVCMVCLVNPADTRLVPCDHDLFCATCWSLEIDAAKQRQRRRRKLQPHLPDDAFLVLCPYCRKPVLSCASTTEPPTVSFTARVDYQLKLDHQLDCLRRKIESALLADGSTH